MYYALIFINIKLMGNCCYQFTPPITSIEQHENNNQNAMNSEEKTNRRLQLVVTPALLEEKPTKIQEQQIQIKLEDKAQEKIVKEEVRQQVNEAFQAIFQLYTQICHFYANHDVDSCIPLISKLEEITANFCKQFELQPKSLEKQLEEYSSKNYSRFISKFKHIYIFKHQTIAQIKRQHADILHYQQEIKGGVWEESSNSKGVRLCTRKQENSVGVLIEMDLQLPFEVLISILIQIDLYPEFLPFNQISKQQKTFSRNCRIGYNLNNYPFLSKRQAFFQGIGYSRLKTHKEVFLFTRSIHDKKDLQEYLEYHVKINPDYVQLTYKYFVVKYRPIRKGLGRLILALNADIGLNFLPNFVLEYLAKDFAKQFLQCILDIGQHFQGSKWEKNIQKNPALFNFFKYEIEEYLQQIK